jgi:hypothetical protein
LLNLYRNYVFCGSLDNSTSSSINYLTKNHDALLFFATILQYRGIKPYQSCSRSKYISVGEDSAGFPFLLDITTMGQADHGFGNVLHIYQVKGGLTKEMLIQSSCTKNRLRVVGIRYYNENSIPVSLDKRQQELPIQQDSPASKAISYYCHSIGASGW